MESLKDGNKSRLVLLLAVLLIAAGVVLIVTGNNKSFIAKDKPKEENKQEEPKEDEPEDVNRGNVATLTEESAKEILNQKKESDLKDETWTIGEVTILAEGNNKSYLISYEKVNEDGSIDVLQTIISIENGVGIVELPGWFEGERELDSYEFVYNNDETEDGPGDEPIEEPEEYQQNDDNDEVVEQSDNE